MGSVTKYCRLVDNFCPLSDRFPANYVLGRISPVSNLLGALFAILLSFSIFLSSAAGQGLGGGGGGSNFTTSDFQPLTASLSGNELTIGYRILVAYNGGYTPWASVAINNVVLETVQIPSGGLTANPSPAALHEITFNLGTSADGTYMAHFCFFEPNGTDVVGKSFNVVISGGTASITNSYGVIITLPLISVTPYPDMPIDMLMGFGSEFPRGFPGYSPVLANGGLFCTPFSNSGQTGFGFQATGSGAAQQSSGSRAPGSPRIDCGVVDSGEPEFPECNNPGGGHVPGESTCDTCGMPGGLIDGRGCSSGCGGGLLDGRGGNQLITSLRGMPWNAWYWSSFGPGVFIDYDSSAYIVDQDGVGISIRLYDAEIGKAITLREPDENGVFGDTLSVYRATELKDSSDDVTTDLAQAVKLVVTRYDGRQMVFELYDDPGEPGGPDLDKEARLIQLLDRNGQGTTITYAGSDTREIDTVTDRYGYAMTFTYGTTIAGRPTVTEIELPNTQVVTFSYANNFIHEIAMPEDVTWTCDVAYNSTSQQTELTVTSPFTGVRVYHIAPDMMEFNSQIISQPTNCFRAALDENGAPIMILLPNPSGNDPDQYRLWCGGDRLSLLQLGQWHRYYSAWTLGDINDGWDAFTSLTIEDTYTQRVYPPAQDLGVTEAERDKMFFCGTTPVVVSGVGSGGSSYPIECGFDADHFLTRIDYPDSTFEEYDYNDFKQITRHRDRKGNVQLWVYDSAGNLLEHKVGLKEVSGSDVQQAEYAVYEYEYYSTPAALKGNLKTAFSPLHTSETDLYRTDYEYLTNGQLETIIESADVASGTRPETTFTYNSLGQVATVTDPEAHTTTYTDDYLGRLRRITYHDSSSDYAHFGTSAAGLAGQVIWTKDRMDVVTSFTYDDLYRVTDTLVGSHTADSSNNLTAITDVTQQRSTSTAFIGTTRLPHTVTTDGKYTLYDYDFRHRLIKTRRWPHANQVLQTRTVYDNYNRVFYTEDPYERREYMGYSATNEPSLIRRVQANHAGYTLADNAAVLAVTRSTSANAAFTVVDAIKDASGNLEEVIDARGISTTYVYDSRDRETSHVAADGTSVAAQTDTIYNKASQVTEVRSPRYFDSGDAQDEYMRTLFTYTGRGLQKTQQVAPGASWFADATTSTTYTLDGKVATTTDALSNVWTTHHDNGCCGHFVGSEDPLGHGSMTFSDNMGRAYHGVSVSDYDTHSGSNPTDVKTLSEWTTRFDNLGRSVARTQWLVAQSTIDPLAVRIAGLDSVSASDGITTLTFYDNNIGDGVGLDSTGGMTLPKLGGGTYSLSLESLLDILADTEANGGANTTFDDGVSAGSAVVSIAPTEEISVSISDATGRTVMSAQLQAHNGTTPLAIINWNSQVYDQEVNISGFGDVIETRSVNRAGKLTKSRSDASGRVLESYDQLDEKSWSEYDPAGNITKSRDPNGVGFDATYDELGRMLTQTDTFGDMTESVYDKEGNVIEQIDAKGNSTFMVYDAQNRRRTVTDRLSGVTTYALNAGGQLTALTDAESQTTSYTYNARGEKTEEEYPDHTSGSPGDSTYGKILFTYDPAGRLSRRDDQNGDTVTHTYDMAGRLLQKDYRTRANSPTGTIADSDTFTYDRSSRMLTAVSGRYSNTVTNTYDVAGRLKDESLTIATKTYTVSRTYDSLGRLFQMTYPNSTVVERTYTDRNQLYTVKYGANIEDTRSYDDGGRLSTSAYRNGVTTTYNYRNVSGNKDNLLASIQFAHPGGTATNRQVGDLTYTWDANKNKTKETIAGTLSGYSFDTTLGTDPDGYDDEDRITYFKRSNTTNPQTWTLTSVGDWSSWNNFSTTAETRTHGAAHELTRIGSGTTPATILYDVKGNITQNQRTPGTSSTYQNYVWDFDNRMVSADTNGDSTADVTYEYDALGRRVARTQGATAVVYIHAGQQTVCDYTRGANANTTPAFRYVWGDYIDEPILRQTGSSTLLYYHHNQQYSTVAITSASGLVVTRYGYTAYGDQTIMSHTGASQTYATYSLRHTYTGREWDDSLKAHYFRARWYDAPLGRFVNRDPIGYVDGASLYRGYFSLENTDPTGLDVALGNRSVCCTYDNGSVVWSWTLEAARGETAGQRCKRRYAGAWGGWFSNWKLLGAVEGKCDDPPPESPATVEECLTRGDWLDCMTCCMKAADPYGQVHRTVVGVAGFRYPKCELPGGVYRFRFHPQVWETTNPWRKQYRTLGTQLGKQCGIGPKLGRQWAGRAIVIVTVVEGYCTWGLMGYCSWKCGTRP